MSTARTVSVYFSPNAVVYYSKTGPGLAGTEVHINILLPCILLFVFALLAGSMGYTLLFVFGLAIVVVLVGCCLAARWEESRGGSTRGTMELGLGESSIRGGVKTESAMELGEADEGDVEGWKTGRG